MDILWTPEAKKYVETDLIPYIGNKRRLLPLLIKALQLINIDPKQSVFADFFAGTGCVARLARTQGFRCVIANDWESYTQPVLRAALCLSPLKVDTLFKKWGGFSKTLDILNALQPLPLSKSFFATYYAPSETKNPDLQNERLFYTHENAQKIDAIRHWIREVYENRPISHDEFLEKNLLLSLLITEASRRSNTNGVFKAFHYGYGGRKKDALRRILSPIRLSSPLFWNGPNKNIIYNQDANNLQKTLKENDQKIDITYLDPPYNQHQYGSNYHILTTIAHGDRPSIPKSIKPQMKAGIRTDWKLTHSDYCNRKKAIEAFSSLIETLDSNYILMSCSSEGFLSQDVVIPILEKRGKTDIIAQSYTRYRGGKQAVNTTTSNVESIIILDTQKRPRNMQLSRSFLESQVKVELTKPALIENWSPHNPHPSKPIFVIGRDEPIELIFEHGLYPLYLLQPNLFDEPLSLNSLRDFRNYLQKINKLDHLEEAETIISRIESYLNHDNYESATDLLYKISKKINKLGNKLFINKQGELLAKASALCDGIKEKNINPSTEKKIKSCTIALQKLAQEIRSNEKRYALINPKIRQEIKKIYPILTTTENHNLHLIPQAGPRP